MLPMTMFCLRAFARTRGGTVATVMGWDHSRHGSAVLPAAAKVLQNVVGTYRRIAVPFIEEYWNVAFKRERFRFSAPSDVQNSLSEAALLPTSQRAQAILRTIATSLGVQIHDEAKSWLYGSSHEPT